MYEALTKYLNVIPGDEIGAWIIDRKSKGTADDPIQMPYVHYSEMAMDFIQDVHAFFDTYKGFELMKYNEVLEANNIVLKDDLFTDEYVSTLDGKLVVALIVAVVRGERFCDGLLHGYFMNGTIEKWLRRLAELDDETEARV